MANEIANLKVEIKEYQLQLETVQLGLQAEPSNVELQNLKSELEEIVSLTEAAIAELRPAAPPLSTSHAPSSSSPQPPTTKPAEKWSKENHPAYRKAPPLPPDDAPPPPPPPSSHHPAFSVNDTVLAKWTSGDNAFYPARITSITGSSSAPVYIVVFKSYDTTETLSGRDIKPISSNNHDPNKKRKADASPTSTTTITASPSINPVLATQARTEPSKVSDGPVRPPKIPRKVKANKELEAGKTKWQDFALKGKGGKMGGLKKDSMFRTPEGIHGRVGLPSSAVGGGAKKDVGRSRHVHARAEEDDI